MLGPTRDAREPAGKQPEFLVAELVGKIFEEEDREDLFFEHAPAEQAVRDPQQESRVLLAPDNPAKTDSDLAEFRRVPAASFHFLLEEPLHVIGMRGGAAVLQNAADVGGDVLGRDSAFRHGWAQARRRIHPFPGARGDSRARAREVKARARTAPAEGPAGEVPAPMDERFTGSRRCAGPRGPGPDRRSKAPAWSARLPP